MAEPSEERTEEATDKRMKEVRSKGQLGRSQDLSAWVGVGAAAAMLPMTFGRATDAATRQVFDFATIIENPEPAVALGMFQAGLGSTLSTLGPMLAAVAVAVILASVVQGGLHWKKFKPETQQFNPISGLKRIFGTQAMWNGLKALLKTLAIGAVLYMVVQSFMPVLLQAGGLQVSAVLATAGSGISTLLLWAIAAGVALAAVDVWVVIKRNRKKTKMTKKEVKDEHKSSDGDPLVRQQRRSRQLAISRNRMISEVGDSSVVLVNPTHVAVALKYEPGKSAPRVVAKGADHLAGRIREAAAEAGVPMVRDVPLARTLNSVCKVGQEIPAELFLAVARVLAFVMMLKKRGASFCSDTPHNMGAPAIKPGEWPVEDLAA